MKDWKRKRRAFLVFMGVNALFLLILGCSVHAMRCAQGISVTTKVIDLLFIIFDFGTIVEVLVKLSE